MQLGNITYGAALVIMIGWMLWIGKPILLPVITALISVYILSTAATHMERYPIIQHLPLWARHMLVLIGFAGGVALFFMLVTNNITQVIAALVRYEANLDALVTQSAGLLGIEDEPTWSNLRRITFDEIDIRSWIAPVLVSLQGLGTFLFLVVLFAVFFMAERGSLAKKLVLVFDTKGAGERALVLLQRVNDRIGGYLFVKTVVNVILGAMSYAIMLVLGIEFALFWAVLIAFLNYVPYIGSLVGVLFPVLLSLAQFGTLSMAGLVAISLTAAQMFVGGYLEPRLLGRAFNLSPFMILLALLVWSTLWGLPGAVLAVPFTTSLVLVLAEIRSTRRIAIMLSSSGRV
ncbi:AI-2E family transporter [Tateyamaria sp. syn59]|uniref:AI-2E family transporter n=1 Tax=Tateyamaria sp. syn59 TaxID=2576942 RepID=UPI0011BD9270|nr:AI-2E family transporter [Tateyamaria sp. syn59]